MARFLSSPQIAELLSFARNVFRDCLSLRTIASPAHCQLQVLFSSGFLRLTNNNQLLPPDEELIRAEYQLTPLVPHELMDLS